MPATARCQYVSCWPDVAVRHTDSFLCCSAVVFSRRMSPWSTGRAVATTDQLNRYLAQYATPSTSQQPEEQPTPETGPMGSGFGGMYGDAADQGLPPSPALPMGRDAPAYRPSLVSQHIDAPTHADRVVRMVAGCTRKDRRVLNSAGVMLWASGVVGPLRG